MRIVPAIDVLGGKVVRLRRGSYDDVTVYSDDPVAQAARFQEQGATHLHVVDLDGARAGRPVNGAIVERIVARGGLEVQVGGGVRDRDTALYWSRAGASVVLGTAAMESPELVRSLAETIPGIVVALDARGGEVAVKGWRQGSGRKLADAAREVAGWGIAAILYTSIERDGTSEGPDVSGTAELQRAVSGVDVIASGGIGALDHVRALARAGVRAAVVGRALYEGSFGLAEAIAAATEDA